MTTTSIAVIGGGPWIVQLLDLLSASSSFRGRDLDLRLAGQRIERLQVVAEHARALWRAQPGDLAVRATTDLGEAVTDADAIVVMVRIGGTDARRHDESFPIRFGLAGDEGLGPGGFANAWRSVPFVRDLGRTIRAVAPRAHTLNLMAPLGITTRVLLDEGVPAVGLCELPAVTERSLAAALGRGRTCGAHLGYAGLNHLGWFYPTDALTTAHLDRLDLGVVGVRRIDWERFGAVPLPYYPKLFGAAPSTPPARTRADELALVSEELQAELGAAPGAPPAALGRRAMPWFEDAVLPALEAVVGAAPRLGFANVENQRPSGQPVVPGLPTRAVIEVRGTTGCDGFEPETPPRPPVPVLAFLRRLAESELCATRAAAERCPATMAEALRSHPLRLRTGVVDALVPLICRPERAA